MAKQELTLKNFSAQLKGTVRAIRNQTEKSLQAYIVFAGEYYLRDGNSGLLTECVNACVGAPALATNKMIGYIVDASDLKCVSVKNSDDKQQRVFKREQKGSDVERKFTLPAYNWTAFEKQPSTKPWDDVQAIKNVIAKYRKELPNMKGKKLAESLARCKVLCELVGDEEVLTVKLVTKKAA